MKEKSRLGGRMMTLRIKAGFATLCVVMVGCLACACGTTTASPPTTRPAKVAKAVPATATTTAPSVGPKVLAILTNLNNQDSALSDTTNYSALASDFQMTATQLQALTYPANAQADAKSVIHDLNTIAAEAVEENVTALQTDFATAHADTDALRNDLGLPAAPLGS